jgi:uncharacterized membrane protein
MQPWSWIAWNIFLAAVPVICAYTLAAGIKAFTLRGKRITWLVWLPLALVWLAFLPNTCYLLTEWRHFLEYAHSHPIYGPVSSNPSLLLEDARECLLFLAYSVIGILCFTLSIRPVEQVLKQARVQLLLLAVPFFLLISLGVYMGLIVRLNSWEIVNRPLHVWNVAVHAVTTPLLLQTIVAFAIVLWLIYQAVNIWVDGVALRFHKKSPSQKSPPRAKS